MASLPELTLPLRCLTCGRPVTVVYESRLAPVKQIVNCPWKSCKGTLELALRGIVLAARPGEQISNPVR